MAISKPKAECQFCHKGLTVKNIRVVNGERIVKCECGGTAKVVQVMGLPMMHWSKDNA